MIPVQSDAGVKRIFGGANRTRLPVDTLEQLLPIKHRFGITRLANVTGLDRVGLPVALAIRPNSRSVAVSQGKGVSLDEAKASALMEAIELWHAENLLRPLLFASHSELSRDHLTVDVARLPRTLHNRYTDNLRLHWIEGTNLVTGKQVLVPYQMVHANYTHPLEPGHGCFAASTNGLASGNHPLEAICHSICEVVERDAVTLWHHLPASLRAVTMIDPATIDCSLCNDILRTIRQAGLEVALWDVTSDVGIATFCCLITDEGDPQGHVGLGTATHINKAAALAKSLTEAVQTRMNYITGSRDDLKMEEFMSQGRAQKAREARTLLRKAMPMRDFKLVPSRETATFHEDVEWLIERLASIGISEVTCVDLSSNIDNIFVVRIVIPGLEAPHDDDTFVPGPRALAVARQ
jgi:ribosomal protein S12 methylthiotransferase accessory factor